MFDAITFPGNPGWEGIPASRRFREQRVPKKRKQRSSPEAGELPVPPKDRKGCRPRRPRWLGGRRGK